MNKKLTILMGITLTLLVSITNIGYCQHKAQWTVMVFLNGDNDLEYDAIDDFLEMARVGSLFEDGAEAKPIVNVVAQFDRIKANPQAGQYNDYDRRYGDWGQTLRFLIKKNMLPTVQNAIEDVGEKNMGDGATLAGFVQWAKNKYPAHRYMLVVWDHGQGWRTLNPIFRNIRGKSDFDALIASPMFQPQIKPNNLAIEIKPNNLTEKEEQKEKVQKQLQTDLKIMRQQYEPQNMIAPSWANLTSPLKSVSSDDTSGGRMLFNREVRDAISSAMNGEKLALLGFDACLMGMVETCYEMRNIAVNMVGSEELEPGSGWRYDDWLSILVSNPMMNGRMLSQVLVDSYSRTYATTGMSTTLSAIDLLQMEALANAITNFAIGLALSLNTPAELANIKNARAACSIYAPREDRFFHIDLGRFCDVFSASTANIQLRQLSNTVRQALKSCVLHNYFSADRSDMAGFGSNGLAIYFPESLSQYQSDPNASAYTDANNFYPIDFVKQHRWDNFLMAFYQK